MAQNFVITLSSWTFPKLDPDKANFRFVVQLRYFTKDGSPATANNVLPSADSYWECDWRKPNDRRYVGPNVPNNSEPPGYGTVDAAKFNAYDKVAFLVQATSLQSVNVTIYDVDRKDFWDSFLAAFAKAVEGLLGRLTEALPSSIDVPDIIKATIARRLAGPSDRIIGTTGILFPAANPVGNHVCNLTVKGGSYQGAYSVSLTVV